MSKYEIEIVLEDFVKITQAEHADVLQVGDNVENTNENCVHYGSKGKVVAMLRLPDEMGNVVAYQCTESGKTDGAEWKDGDVLLKTESQLKRAQNDKSTAKRPPPPWMNKDKKDDKKNGDKKKDDKKNGDKKNGDKKNGDKKEKGKDGKKLPPWLNKKKK